MFQKTMETNLLMGMGYVDINKSACVCILDDFELFHTRIGQGSKQY